MVTIDLVVCISCDQKCHFRNAASNTTLQSNITTKGRGHSSSDYSNLIDKNAEKINHSYANI